MRKGVNPDRPRCTLSIAQITQQSFNASSDAGGGNLQKPHVALAEITRSQDGNT